MQRSARVVLGGFFALVLLTQFTNCGDYQAPSSTLDSTDSVACLDTACVSEAPTNLMVSPHLYNGEYAVPANLTEFNIGGDCNEGGYLNNTIHWDLLLNGQIVRNSTMQLAAGVNAESRCINGRFLIYVPLTPLSVNNADPVNRTGLMIGSGTTRSSYNLHITIFVTDPTTGAAQQYQSNVPLDAI
jgi:hypothetical protein